jgi:taurine transport system permease protein
LLTNEKLVEDELKNKIKEITGKINSLTEEFQKISYPEESIEEENKRIESSKKEGKWSASGTAVENTIEIPTIPKQKKD